MGFFCYSCEKKVRGQPNNHGCTRKKYGNKANDRIYDKSGNKQHRIDRRQTSNKKSANQKVLKICNQSAQGHCFEYCIGCCDYGNACRYQHVFGSADPGFPKIYFFFGDFFFVGDLKWIRKSTKASERYEEEIDEYEKKVMRFEVESDEYDFNDRDLTRLEEWRAIVQQWDIETSTPCRYNSR